MLYLWALLSSLQFSCLYPPSLSHPLVLSLLPLLLFPFVSFSTYHFGLSHQWFSLSLPHSPAANSLVCCACWKGERMFHCVSGTFQLACIPASGCVADKIEPIPPSYCYLCFLPVTHKQSCTCAHTRTCSYMSRRVENTRVPAPVLQMHWTDSYSKLTRGGQVL